jgi:hypothetical protein
VTVGAIRSAGDKRRFMPAIHAFDNEVGCHDQRTLMENRYFLK